MPQPIQAISMTYVSARDRNGNKYEFSLVWSVLQGKEKVLSFGDCSASNIRTILTNFFGGNHEVSLSLEQTNIKRAEWDELRRINKAMYRNGLETQLALQEMFPKKG